MFSNDGTIWFCFNRSGLVCVARNIQSVIKHTSTFLTLNEIQVIVVVNFMLVLVNSNSILCLTGLKIFTGWLIHLNNINKGIKSYTQQEDLEMSNIISELNPGFTLSHSIDTASEWLSSYSKGKPNATSQLFNLGSSETQDVFICCVESSNLAETTEI